MKEETIKVNVTHDEAYHLVLALRAKLNELQGLPEPLAGTVMKPFIELHDFYVGILEDLHTDTDEKKKGSQSKDN